MRKVVVLATALVCFLPCAVFAQGFTGYTGFPSSAFFPTSFTDSYNLAGFNLTGNAKIGYMKTGMNFNLPTLPPAFPLVVVPAPGSIDLQIRGKWYWMGSVGLSTQVTPNLSLSAYVEGNLQKNATAVTTENDILSLVSVLPWTWEASKFQWWAIDARAAYKVCPQFSILAGFRADHLSSTLRDPVDAFGNPVNFDIVIPLGQIGSIAGGQRTAGDFLGRKALDPICRLAV